MLTLLARRASAAIATAVLLAAAPLQAAPGDMAAATFLARAEALKARGIGAIFSGDIKLLTSEGKAAGERYRARLAADRAAGRSPQSCPPAHASINSDALLSHLRSYPPAQRQSTTMTTAMGDLFAKLYPCPAAR